MEKTGSTGTKKNNLARILLKNTVVSGCKSTTYDSGAGADFCKPLQINDLHKQIIASPVPTLPRFTEKKNAFFCKKDLATREKVCYNKRMSKAQIERAIQVKIQAFRSHKIKWMNAERQGNLMESIKWENAMAQDLDAIERFKSMKPLEVN